MNSISLIKKIMSLGIALIITGFIYTSINNADARQKASVQIDIGSLKFKVMEDMEWTITNSNNVMTFDIAFDVTMKFNDKVKVKIEEDCSMSITDTVVMTIDLLPDLNFSIPPLYGGGCGFASNFYVKEGGNWKGPYSSDTFKDGSDYFGVQMELHLIPHSATKAEIKVKGHAYVGPAHTALRYSSTVTLLEHIIHL